MKLFNSSRTMPMAAADPDRTMVDKRLKVPPHGGAAASLGLIWRSAVPPAGY
jgi:hypothetical protein